MAGFRGGSGEKVCYVPPRGTTWKSEGTESESCTHKKRSAGQCGDDEAEPEKFVVVVASLSVYGQIEDTVR